VVVVLGGLAAAATMQLSRLKTQLVDKQRQIVTLTSQNDELQQQRTQLEAERKDLEARLNEMRAQLTSATGELGRLRDSFVELQARYETLEGDKSQLETQVSRLTKERDEARVNLGRLDDEKKDLERAAIRLRERLAFLDRDYQRLAAKVAELEQTGGASLGMTLSTGPTETGPSAPTAPVALGAAPPQTVELPPIIVRKHQAGMGTGLPVRAQVAEVNEAHRFVVIDKGANDGVVVGMGFDILRSGAKVGQVVAVRVRPQLAACELVGSRSPEFPHTGDLAIQRNP